jgi:hypothetical protein
VWASDVATPTGTFTIEATDPVDGNLANRPHDSLVLKSTGRKGDAVHVTEVTLAATPDPLPALAYAVHTDGEIYILGSKTFSTPSATASANGNFRNLGTLSGSVQSQGCSDVGTITGTSDFSAGTKALPAATVVDNYIALGTVIAPGATIDRKVLAAGKNPWGATNADGVYVVYPAADLTIRNSRIHGTLVVVCGTGYKVRIEQKVIMHPYRSDYPSLIVQGDAEFAFSASASSLTELGIATNLNPAGAPYNGVTDGDMGDSYPSEIQGLVHVTGKAKFNGTSRIRGVLLVGSSAAESVAVEQSADVQYTPTLLTSPPQWYTVDVKMIPTLGTWKQLSP